MKGPFSTALENLRDLELNPNLPFTRDVSCDDFIFSTLNHNLGCCCSDARVVKWVARLRARTFQGISGSFYERRSTGWHSVEPCRLTPTQHGWLAQIFPRRFAPVVLFSA